MHGVAIIEKYYCLGRTGS